MQPSHAEKVDRVAIAPPPPPPPEPRTRRWVWTKRIAGAFIGLFAALVVILNMIDEPLRQEMERRLNAELKGYTVSIGRLDLHPLGFALELEEVSIVQNARPTPPVAYFPRWTTSVQWRELLTGSVVADTVFDGPRIFITFEQAQGEAQDATPAEDRGWQDALAAVYPFEINEFRVNDGEITYYDGGKMPPVELKAVDFLAGNIRNVRSVAGRFPSPVTLRSELAPKGTLAVDGNADFLAKPQVALNGQVRLADVALAEFAPMAQHWGLTIEGGTLAATAQVEQVKEGTTVRVDEVVVTKPVIDYVQRRAEDERRVERVTKAATTAEVKPAVRVDVEEARVSGGTLGFIDATGDPAYRLFLADADLTLRGFSNQVSERKGSATVRARFMNSGPAALDATFASGKRTPEFTLDLRFENVELTTLNDLLRRRADFDVKHGKFSLFSELAVRNGRVDGYVKPLFADMDVYDREQDSKKGIGRQAWEAVVGGVATLLENRPRDEVATRADLSGPIENPNASTLQIVIGLIQNAFFKAIVPGLEHARRGGE